LFIEYFIFCATIVFSGIFIGTSLKQYFEYYVWSSIALQGFCTLLVILFPRHVARFFDLTNQKPLLLGLPVLFLIVLFGGPRSGGKGLMYFVYGEDISDTAFTIVFAGIASLSLIYLFGGITSGLVRAGYFD
jgi:hypothetical protein